MEELPFTVTSTSNATIHNNQEITIVVSETDNKKPLKNKTNTKFSKEYTELLNFKNKSEYVYAIKSLAKLFTGECENCDIVDLFLFRGVAIIPTGDKSGGVIIASEDCPVVAELAAVPEFKTGLIKQTPKYIWNRTSGSFLFELTAFVSAYSMMRSFPSMSRVMKKITTKDVSKNLSVLAAVQLIIHETLAYNARCLLAKILISQSTKQAEQKMAANDYSVSTDTGNKDNCLMSTTTTTATAATAAQPTIIDLLDLVSDSDEDNNIRDMTAFRKFKFTTNSTTGDDVYEQCTSVVENSECLLDVFVVGGEFESGVGHIRDYGRIGLRNLKFDETVTYCMKNGSNMAKLFVDQGYRIPMDTAEYSQTTISARVFCSVYAIILLKAIFKTRL
jgi:hypothetical protein